MSSVLSEKEILLNGIRYPITVPVRKTLTSIFAPKITIGDTTGDNTALTKSWTYTIDNTLAATQNLGKDQTVTEEIILTIDDDNINSLLEQTITISLVGTNDRPTIKGGVAIVINGTEDTQHTINNSDLISVAEDVDTDAVLTAFNLELDDNSQGGLSSTDVPSIFTPTANINGDVKVNFKVKDEHDAIVQDGGVDKIFTATITLAAVNDNPVISSVVRVLNEDGQPVGVTDTSSGTPQTTGQINATDIDGNTTFTYSAATPAYGSIVVNSDGSWTYSLDINNPTIIEPPIINHLHFSKTPTLSDSCVLTILISLSNLLSK